MSMERCLNCETRGQTYDSELCASCWLNTYGSAANAEAFRGDGR